MVGMEGEMAGRVALGTRTGLPLKAMQEAVCSPLPETVSVQLCSLPIVFSFFSQEKLNRFLDDSEFNLVYENL